jgi:hypothetical protein
MCRWGCNGPMAPGSVVRQCSSGTSKRALVSGYAHPRWEVLRRAQGLHSGSSVCSERQRDVRAGRANDQSLLFQHGLDFRWMDLGDLIFCRTDREGRPRAPDFVPWLLRTARTNGSAAPRGTADRKERPPVLGCPCHPSKHKICVRIFARWPKGVLPSFWRSTEGSPRIGRGSPCGQRLQRRPTRRE